MKKRYTGDKTGGLLGNLKRSIRDSKKFRTQGGIFGGKF